MKLTELMNKEVFAVSTTPVDSGNTLFLSMYIEVRNLLMTAAIIALSYSYKNHEDKLDNYLAKLNAAREICQGVDEFKNVHSTINRLISDGLNSKTVFSIPVTIMISLAMVSKDIQIVDQMLDMIELNAEFLYA